MGHTVATPSEGLRPAAQTASLSVYLKELRQRRDYVTHVAASELRAQRVTTVLGNVWHLLNPALQIGVYYVIFGLVLETSRGVDNFISFLAIGIFVFSFTQRATMVGARSVVGNLALIRSFAFPRLLLPITTTAVEVLAYLPAMLVALAITVMSGGSPRWSWLVLPALIPLQAMFNAGLAFIAARATFLLRDVDQILPFLFRLVFYGSGVLFLVDAYVHSKHRWMFIGNPIYCFIDLYRWAILGLETDLATLLSALIWSMTAFVVGFVWFRAGERSFGRG